MIQIQLIQFIFCFKMGSHFQALTGSDEIRENIQELKYFYSSHQTRLIPQYLNCFA